MIIPVYNSAVYLKRCVDSVLEQSLNEIEIILVDDGSTDESSVICDKYANKNKNIKVIHQRNLGPAIARNVGMKIANGEYIGFVDSDDFVSPDMFETLYKIGREENLDIVIGNYQVIKDGNVDLHRENEIAPPNRKIFHNEIVDLIMQPDHDSLIWFTWKSIFRKSLLELNAIEYFDGMLGEDTIFNIDAMLSANAIYYINEPFYSYVQTKNSLIRKPYKDNLLNRLEKNFNKKEEVLKKHNIVDYQKSICTYAMSHSLVMLISNVLNGKKKIRWRMKEYRRIRQSKFVCMTFDTVSVFIIPSRIKWLALLLKWRLYFLSALLSTCIIQSK